MYGKLDDKNIDKIQNADISMLDTIAKNAYNNLVPLQKRYAEEYLICKNEKHAALNAGYINTAIPGQLVRLRKNINICLFISSKEELKNRDLLKQIEDENKNVDADKEMSKDACRAIIGDPDSKKSEILSAIDILAKLNGVYKEAPNTGKNKAFSIKIPDNMRDSENTREITRETNE